MCIFSIYAILPKIDLEFCVSRVSWERNHVPNVLDTRHHHNEPL